MIERLLPAGPHHRVRLRCTDRADGDFHVAGSPAALAERRARIVPGPWTWLHQVHGSHVVAVDEPGAAAGSKADGSVTARAGAVLAVQSADCAPVVLAAEGAVAVVHAGWRGLVAGVIPAAVTALRHRADGDVHAMVGPCIAPAHYEFGPEDLQLVVDVVGDEARAKTSAGRPALDLGAAVRAQCRELGVASCEPLVVDGAVADTSDGTWFSHRVRADAGRQATVAWLEPT